MFLLNYESGLMKFSFESFSCGYSRVSQGSYILSKLTKNVWRIVEVTKFPHTLTIRSKILGETKITPKDLYDEFIPYEEYLDNYLKNIRKYSIELDSTNKAIKSLTTKSKQLETKLYDLTIEIEKLRESINYVN